MNNLFLTGMMGCGKTSIGRVLAAWTGASFLDLDAVIEEISGMRIAEIFAAEGEAGFRERETAALREAAEQENCIVATGGGAILSEENVAIMRGGGLIAFIDRPLAAILSDVDTSVRPLLAGGKDKVREIFIARIELYRSRCDIRVENTTTVDDAAALLQRLLWPGTV